MMTLISIKFERFPEYEDLCYSGRSSKVVETTLENLDNLIVEIKRFISELNKSEFTDYEINKSDFVKFNRFDEIGYRLTKSLYPEDYIWVHSVECVQIDDTF